MKISTFHIEELCCSAEESVIRSRLAGIEGIELLEFNLLTRNLRVTHDLPEERTISDAISSVGMTPSSCDRDPATGATMQANLPTRSFWRRRVVILTAVSGLFAIVAELLALLGPGEDALVVRILAGCAVVSGGYLVAGKGWHALKSRTLNINVLMALATIGALILGDWTEGAMVVFLFAIAELIEERSLDRARGAVRALMTIAPSVATTLHGLGWKELPVEEITPGSIVRIRPGERLALDGVVRHGYSAVDQAPITGESIPVEKSVGDQVFAGSINGTGTFDFEVTHSSADSTIGRIVRLLEEAAANRTVMERFVDRFARIYTPAIVLAAALVVIIPPLLFGGLWDVWFYRGLVLLVIGCPCALVISTPVTVVSGLAGAARRGVLVKGGSYLEQGKDIRVVAFDKTGTLTEGRPRVTDVIPLGSITAEELLHLAAAVEARSEHPIASAIIAEHDALHVDEEEIAVDGFHSVTGRGVRGDVEGRTVHCGNHRLAHDLGLCNDELERRLDQLEAQGKTTVVVMDDDGPLGVIAVADTIRPAARRVIAELHRRGIITAMMTGDNERTARSIAAELGIDDIRADLLPDDKIAAIAELEKRYGPVAMVGDGINDVPALARATIGIAMGAAGTDIALEAADVALMEDNLDKLVEFIDISHRTMRLLRQNITVALGFKVIFFVLALFGEATLWMAVFADMGASLIVVGNGLRLLRGGR